MREREDTEATVARLLEQVRFLSDQQDALREQVQVLRDRQRELDLENARLRGRLSVYPTPMQLCGAVAATLLVALWAALVAMMR